jgi:hypothetical protein
MDRPKVRYGRGWYEKNVVRLPGIEPLPSNLSLCRLHYSTAFDNQDLKSGFRYLLTLATGINESFVLFAC